MYLALCVFLAADLFPILRDAADVPVAVPQYRIAGCLYLICQLMIMLRILSLPEDLRQRDKMLQCPVVQEAYHGALTTAQIQAVIPVGAESLADSVVTDLLSAEVQNPLQMFIYTLRYFISQYVSICIGELFSGKIQVSCFFYVLYHCTHKPQGIIGAGILDSVDHALFVRLRDHRR